MRCAPIKTTCTAALVLLLAACSSDGNSNGKSDAAGGNTGGETTTLKTFGEHCTTDAACGTGMCLLSEYAPFGWCTAPCTEVKEPCAADQNGDFGGYCVEMPDDFPDSPKKFCVPICKNIFECQAKTPLWEECKKPQWKGNVLYGDSEVLACQAPSAHGQIKIDPVTCANWKEAFGEFQSQIALCEAYCDYLTTCKEVPAASTYNVECCGYGCTLQMTQGGEVSKPYEKKIKCYVQNHTAFLGLPQVCSEPTDVCGKKPEDPRPQ